MTENKQTDNVDGFFDQLLELLNVPHTKGSPWYEDRKEKIYKLWQSQQLSERVVSDDEIDRLREIANDYEEEDNRNIFKDGFQCGYKAALTTDKRFSLKDIEDAFDAGYDYRSSLLPEIIQEFGENTVPNKQQYLQSIGNK